MKRKKRFLAMLMLLILCVGEISSTGLKVFAAGDEEDTVEAVTDGVSDEDIEDQEEPCDGAGFNKSKSNTGLGTIGLMNPNITVNDMANWEGSFVYYGKRKGGSALKFRVLDKDSSDFHATKHSMLLDSDEMLFGTKFYEDFDLPPNANEWNDSTLKKKLNDGTVIVFTPTEDSAILLSTKKNKAEEDGKGITDIGFVPLVGEKIFALDVTEATRESYGYGFDNDTASFSRMKSNKHYGVDGIGWWLRTPYGDDAGYPAAALVFKGRICKYRVDLNESGAMTLFGASPALNIDLSSILFTSAVYRSYGKLNTEYKLTLLDDDMTASIPSGKKFEISGSTVTVPYSISGSNADNANALSILILDKEYTAGNTNEANIKYYGKLDTAGGFEKNGTGTFTLPSDLSINDWGSGYKVYLIAEDINDEKETDYASSPVELAVKSYDLWVGGTQVTEAKLTDILGDGTASYDPESNTLTFKDATINKGYEYNASAKRSAGVYAKGSDLIIKGNLTVDGTTIQDAICVEDTAANGRKLTLDGNITLKGDYGINTRYTGVEINGGNLEIDVTTSAVKAGAPVSLANGMKVLSPEGAEFRKSTVGEVYFLYESADSNVQVKKATIGSSSVTETYTVTFDLNGKSGTAPAAQTVEKGKTVSKPSDPSAEGLKFVAWCTDKEGKNVYDFATPVTADITLYAKWVEASADTFTVTFDLNGKSGTAPAAQTVEKGKTVSKPADPKAEGFVFKAWCTDKAGKKEYDFSAPVTANITLYAKWEKAEEPVPGPDPIEGGKSALDPIPELVAGVTKDLYLVKGQKFNIGQGWYVDKADKDSKKRVSISKKGAFKAKAEGEAVIKCGSGAEAWEVKLHISKPKMDKKSLKIQLETETEVKTEKIGFTYDKDNLDVLWYSANPDVVTVDESGNVTTVGKGSSKVTAYINGSAYTCTVTVKEKAALLEHTLHVAKGASKSISIKGLKKPQWEESVKDIVSVKKNKVTGVNAGTTVLSFTQDEKIYKVTVIVEDLTMSGTGLKAQGKPGSNKYIIDELKAKDETILSFAGVSQAVVFKSSKPDIAFIDEDLNVVIRNKGKAKFTAKINGKPVTISVTVK